MRTYSGGSQNRGSLNNLNNQAPHTNFANLLERDRTATMHSFIHFLPNKFATQSKKLLSLKRLTTCRRSNGRCFFETNLTIPKKMQSSVVQVQSLANWLQFQEMFHFKKRSDLETGAADTFCGCVLTPHSEPVCLRSGAVSRNLCTSVLSLIWVRRLISARTVPNHLDEGVLGRFFAEAVRDQM